MDREAVQRALVDVDATMRKMAAELEREKAKAAERRLASAVASGLAELGREVDRCISRMKVKV